MLPKGKELRKDSYIETLDLSPELVGRKLLLVCDVHIKSSQRRLVDAFDVKDLLVKPSNQSPDIFILETPHQRRHKTSLLVPSQILDFDVSVLNLRCALFFKVLALLSKGVAHGWGFFLVLFDDLGFASCGTRRETTVGVVGDCSSHGLV
ncbi:hypothetical protein HG530_007704 [Fusarium avenaceum]|nr:hypothetical protein HG530_007704 [Fusarium avenaceum]